MKLDSPIVIRPPKFTNQQTNQIETPAPVKLEELAILYVDSPLYKQYYISIQHIPSAIMLFEGDSYLAIPDITKQKANDRLLELANNDLQSYLQNQIPRTLEDEPYGPGSILASMFSAIGIKSSPTCSCRRHALEMNKNGIEWCENNIETICGWLKEECQKRSIPYVDTVAKMVVNRAINKAKKYRDNPNDES